MLFTLDIDAISCVTADPEDRWLVTDAELAFLMLVCFFRGAPRSPALCSAADGAGTAHAEISDKSCSFSRLDTGDGSPLFSRGDRLLADDDDRVLLATGSNSLDGLALLGGESTLALADDSLGLGRRTTDDETSVAASAAENLEWSDLFLADVGGACVTPSAADSFEWLGFRLADDGGASAAASAAESLERLADDGGASATASAAESLERLAGDAGEAVASASNFLPALEALATAADLRAFFFRPPASPYAATERADQSSVSEDMPSAHVNHRSHTSFRSSSSLSMPADPRPISTSGFDA